ncbi:cell wall anchor protein [Nocardiopsis algeriensis]|uniref:Cell wall anchor protein n=1 Tax=Nocardiopsis algeriensis TaxID=1478215 RepID=A0A841ISS2_9ACTN|nr:hypothetical protein [Nocardiopsis algeriensis]
MTSAQLLTLVALGVFHGVHPGMGWLLAVARGLQEGGRREVVRSLPAIAAGHAASIAVAAVAVTVTGSVTASVLFPVIGGGAVVLAGLALLLSRRHLHRDGIRMPLWQLTAWSFVMSSAHGAGLMLMPVFAGDLAHGAGHGAAHGAGHGAHTAPVAVSSGASPELAPVPAGETWSLWDATLTGLAAAGVHTAAMLAACGAAALIAHDFFGVHALRWRGVTMDRIWAVTLVLGGLYVLWSVW